MVKIIQLKYGRDYANMNGPLKPIDEQVKIILEENKNYTYVGLINESSKYLNMECAALVVEIN